MARGEGRHHQAERAVTWALDSLGKSNDLNESMGSGIAIALLDNDDSIDDAKRVAQELRRLVTDGVFDRVRTERKMKAILDDDCSDPAGCAGSGQLNGK